MSEETVDQFFARHCAAGGLVLAIGISADTADQRYGIFSTLPLARAWSDTLPEGFGVLFTPYIVDEPEWGNQERRQ